MSPDVTEVEEVSFGWVLDRITKSKVQLNDASQKTTEPLETQIARAALDAVEALEDVVLVLRDHLSCHGCDDEKGNDEKPKKRKGKKGKKK